MALTIGSTIKLHNGIDIPLLGLGVYQARAGKATEDALAWAFSGGYRHIDTARIYGNEASVGAAIKASDLDRRDVFVTTKLWNSDHGYDKTLRACERSLQQLGLDYVDLYLVHWPVKKLRVDSWRAMEELLAEGKCRAIGVSNYMIRHLEELMTHCAIIPAVNQIELSPYNYLHRRRVVDFCIDNGIILEAYSPLTKGKKLNDPSLKALARNYEKTPAQVLIRWALQHGFVVLPKSVHHERILENANVFDFALSNEHMRALDDLNEGLATSWDPTDAP